MKKSDRKQKSAAIQSMEPMVLMSATTLDIDVDGAFANDIDIDGVVVGNEVGQFFLRNIGSIDAGIGEDSPAVIVNIGDQPNDVVQGTIVNQDIIAGRGQAEASSVNAGDGIRIVPGAAGTIFDGNIINSGSITSDSNQGPTSAIRIANGVGFDGAIVNLSGGFISGANNGLYFGDAEHNAVALNFGTISSDSRAVNIDGTGVDFINVGQVLGTDSQRNGTVYADATADDFSIRNLRSGEIDAGLGNDGAGIALQTGDSAGDILNAEIINRGQIAGRGQAAATEGTAGDGIRIFPGVTGGTTFSGSLINSGEITSESNQGPTSAVRVANGVGFDGAIVNESGGLIAGANNGLYFGEAEHAVRAFNAGTISSDSRAVNIDGNGVDFVNAGRVLGTGDQRNGTVYADSTADDYSIINLQTGRIDAGLGNDGSGISLQTGDVDNDVVNGAIRNDGVIRGRGDASEGNTIGDGIRVFGAGNSGVTLQGDIVNNGLVRASGSDAAVGIRIEDGISLDGAIVNNGRIVAAETAIDTSQAAGDVFVANNGVIRGDVVLGNGNDQFDNSNGFVSGEINAGDGDDILTAGRRREVFIFDADDGNDTINNFSTRRDRIDVSGAGVTSFSDLQFEDTGNDTIVRFGQTAITFADVSESQLSARNFVFADIDSADSDISSVASAAESSSSASATSTASAGTATDVSSASTSFASSSASASASVSISTSFFGAAAELAANNDD